MSYERVVWVGPFERSVTKLKNIFIYILSLGSAWNMDSQRVEAAYAMLGQFEKALERAECAVQKSPDCAIHRATLAVVLENLSRYNEAQTA